MEGEDDFMHLLSLHFMRFSCLLVQKAFEIKALFGMVLILNVRVTKTETSCLDCTHYMITREELI